MTRLVGRYEVRDRIGQGAMAEVYRAYDPSIDRVLAIKLLKREFRENAECAARFLREARAAGALSHPNIVTIYDVGEADGFPYIAMELLDGEPLDTALKRLGKLAPDAVLAIASQLAEALGYAHAAGLVHRDIKPANIMLGSDGRSIKILDFGIARVAEANADADNLRTQLGQVLGTPRYMSPEQALGRELDGRSDLFSVGVVLYELLTGRTAFSGSSAATLALQITQANPEPIARLTPDCPGGLRFIVEKLLTKRPERRFASGAELGRALKRERAAFEAVTGDAEGRARYLPLQARLTLAMAIVTATALLISIGTVLDRQYRAMERMAITSGSSIASFVASNAALRSVENAALPPDERDWLPVQAFITAAAADRNVQRMTMVDAEGVIRGASDPTLLGRRYAPPRGEPVVHRARDVTVTSVEAASGDGFRFVQPITYAGRSFGLIDVSVAKADLTVAANLSEKLMAGLGLLILLVVIAVSYAMAGLLARPVRRLKAALRDAAMGDLDFRISHRRKDEFGELFDGFNLFTAAMQERLDAAENGLGATSLDATRIGAPVLVPAADARGDASDTPFDADWSRQRTA